MADDITAPGGLGSAKLDRPARLRLGVELRRIRLAAGRTVSDVPGYSKTQVSQVERGRETPSWDLVDKYIAFGGDRNQLRQLYERVRAETAHWRAARLHDRHPVDGPPAEVHPELSHEDIRSHYLLQARAEWYSFDPAGVVTDVQCRSQLVAKAPGVQLFVTRHTYDSDSRPGVLEVLPDSGCTLDTLRTFEDSSLVEAYLRIEPPLGPGDGSRWLSYRVEVRSDRRASPRIQFRASGGLEYFNLTARFQPPAMPTSVWWFAAANTLAIEERSAQRRLPVDPDGCCRKRFELLAEGWYYGLTWTWPPEQRSAPDP